MLYNVVGLLVKITFWLLDINPKIDQDKGTIELWLWGIDAAGNRVLVVDRNFIAYFYAVVAEGFEASKVAEAIMNAYGKSIVTVEVAERRFFGKPVQTIKVYCKVATETGKIAKQLRSLEGVKDCLEDDIRASMRYLIDNNVVPCGWHEVDATEEENTEGVRVSKVYAAKSFQPQPATAKKNSLLQTKTKTTSPSSKTSSPTFASLILTSSQATAQTA